MMAPPAEVVVLLLTGVEVAAGGCVGAGDVTGAGVEVAGGCVGGELAGWPPQATTPKSATPVTTPAAANREIRMG